MVVGAQHSVEAAYAEVSRAINLKHSPRSLLMSLNTILHASLLICSLFWSRVCIVVAFAAKKKVVKTSATASSNRGFGRPPPSLEEILTGFKTRIPELANDQPCPCGVTGEAYGACCAPYLAGERFPMTPSRVLQSRYTAFCWRDVGHIIRTTHPSCRDYQADKVAWAKKLDKNGMFDSFEFSGLTLLGNEEHVNDSEAFVEFEVRLRANQRTGTTLEGQTTTVRERSKFLKDQETGVWTYASGDVRSTVEGVEEVMLNS